MSTIANDSLTAVAKPPRRNRWRLRILLAITGLLAVLFVISRLEPNQVAMLGPLGQYAYDVINPPVEPETSALGKRLIADVKALGGHSQVMARSRRYLGLLGNIEQFHIRITRPDFDDQALERLVNQYGDRIWGLDLRRTKVTDDGLRHLEKLPQLGQLTLGNNDVWASLNVARPISPITDAGLIHLKGLTRLTNLHLDGLPITDTGLDALKDLPALGGLFLSRTKIKGPGLARLKSLPTLAVLFLDGSEIDDQGLRFLSGASNLQYLSLNGTGVTVEGFKALKRLPRLGQLNLGSTGLLDEEVMDLRKSWPELKIERP
jgi:Leucine-rich repeat (LRR) protein